MAKGTNRSTRNTSASSEGSRVSRSAKQARTQDEVGTVRVYLTCNDSKTGKPLERNITGTLYIKDISVSEALSTIEGAF